jgi:tellurite resistance protein TerC
MAANMPTMHLPAMPALLAATPAAGQPELMVPLAFWIGFAVFISSMLALDLGVFHRKQHEVAFKEAVAWSCTWVALALLFGLGFYFWQNAVAGHAQAMELTFRYLTGYIVEISLSIDNLFVIALIFSYFRVPPRYQHSVLFWGIIGALVMRAALIFLGIDLIHRFHWMIYVFGAFLILTGIKMVNSQGEKIEPEKNPVVRLFRRFFAVKDRYYGGSFFIRENSRLFATPLFIALLMVEVTDLIFAVDSIPAILAITPIPFIVITSNCFAVMGLRSMYFALAGFMDRFHLLHFGLSSVLVFIGFKMILSESPFKIPIGISLAVVVLLIGVSVVASLLIKPKHDGRAHGAHADGSPGDILPEDVLPD